jgi:DNA-binding CsgD family transcriptional regulator
MRASAGARIARALKAFSRGGAGSVDVFRETMRHVAAEAPVDGWCGLTLDPATVLPTGGVHEHGLTPTAIRRLLEIEHGERDIHSFADLARAKSPAAALSGAAGAEDSPRYRDVLTPCGYGEELRVVLRAGGAPWGAIVLFRKIGRRPFDADEVELLAGLSEPVGEALRFALITSSTSASASAGDRAILVIGPEGAVESATEPARRLLESLAEVGPPDPLGVPHTVQALVVDARRLASRVDEHRLTSESRVRTRDGRWLTLRASAVGDEPAQRVVVLLEPSGPMEVASLILRAYGLTRREGELVRLVLHGFDTEQIAETMGISPYTVQDHLRSVFDKVGVGSRKELVARVFFTHYLPRMQKGVPPGPDGWFVE